MEDKLERPECQILFRQSSLETRLYPVAPSEESSESSDEEVKTLTSPPKIVDFKMKTPPKDTQEQFTPEEKEDKNDKATAVYLMKSK